MTNTNAPAFNFGGMFRPFESSVYATYAVALTWRDRVAGGTPSDPRLIEGWLKSKMPGMTSDVERRHMLIKTLREMGTVIDDEDLMSISMEQLEEAADKVAATKGANGFKRPNRVVATREVVAPDGTVRETTEVVHPGYLALETRHVKSALRESVNILFAGTRWGKTAKGPKSFTAEHVFVNPVLDPDLIGEDAYLELTRPSKDDERRRIARYPDFLFLTRFSEEYAATGQGPMFRLVTEPNDVETFIGHVTGPKGPQSNLTRVEVVSGATIHFELKVLRDEIKHDHWPIICLAGQEQGLGAMRSQGYGRYDVTRFERTGGKYPHLDWQDILSRIDSEAVLAEYQKAKEAAVKAGEIAPDPTAGMVPVARENRNGKAKKALSGA